MKSDGFLDDIEKIVDEDWKPDKTKLNNHINNSKHKGFSFSKWYEENITGQKDYIFQVHQQEYMKSLEKEKYIRGHIDDFILVRDYTRKYNKKDLTHKCDCGISIRVVYFYEEDKWDASFRYENESIIPSRKIDHFYCPRCTRQIRVMGKILEIAVDKME